MTRFDIENNAYLFSRNYWSIGGQREMDTWVGHQVSLELCQINILSTVKAQRGRDRRNNLRNQTIEVSVSRTFNIQISTTYIIDCLVVNHESTIRVLQSSVGSQNRVVWFNNSSGNLTESNVHAITGGKHIYNNIINNT